MEPFLGILWPRPRPPRPRGTPAPQPTIWHPKQATCCSVWLGAASRPTETVSLRPIPAFSTCSLGTGRGSQADAGAMLLFWPPLERASQNCCVFNIFRSTNFLRGRKRPKKVTVEYLMLSLRTVGLPPEFLPEEPLFLVWDLVSKYFPFLHSLPGSSKGSSLLTYSHQPTQVLLLINSAPV